MLASLPFTGAWTEVIGDLSVPTALVVWLWHRNCTTKGCWRWGHPDPHHGHPVCKRHQKRLPTAQLS